MVSDADKDDQREREGRERRREARETWLNEDLTRKEWERHGADEWSAMLNREWARRDVSLSAAVYWIACQGRPGEPPDDVAEQAARALIDAARNGKTKFPIHVKGRRGVSDPVETVPADHLSFVFPFFDEPDVEQLRAYESGAPFLQWNAFLEGERDDRISTITDRVLWFALTVSKEALRARWPVDGQENLDCAITDAFDAAEADRSPPRHGVDPQAKYKTGAPGRPSAITFVEREAERRREAGEACDLLKDEAAYLNAWCRDKHRDIATPTAKNIANKIGRKHRAWKASRQKPHN